jgi:hypothetical protein
MNAPFPFVFDVAVEVDDRLVENIDNRELGRAGIAVLEVECIG